MGKPLEKDMSPRQREELGEIRKFAGGGSPKELREHILRVCVEKGYDPLVASIDFREELCRGLKQRRSKRRDGGSLKGVRDEDRYEVEILKLIAGVDRDVSRYVYPVVKAYDVHGTVDQSLTVKLIQFSNGEEIEPGKRKLIEVSEEDEDVDLDLSQLGSV